MDSRDHHAGTPFRSRAEFELEFARLLLAVSNGHNQRETVTVEWLQAQSMRLLDRAAPELRPYVEQRVDALANAWLSTGPSID